MIKNKPREILLYRCPACEGYMEGHITNCFNTSPSDWSCVKCKKTFRLSFREIKGNKK